MNEVKLNTEQNKITGLKAGDTIRVKLIISVTNGDYKLTKQDIYVVRNGIEKIIDTIYKSDEKGGGSPQNKPLLLENQSNDIYTLPKSSYVRKIKKATNKTLSSNKKKHNSSDM
jgi:hypothetical protein